VLALLYLYRTGMHLANFIYIGVLGFGLICGGISPQPLDSSQKKAYGQTRNRPIPSQITVRYCTRVPLPWTFHRDKRDDQWPQNPSGLNLAAWLLSPCISEKKRKNGSSGTPVSHNGSVTMQRSWLHFTTGAPARTGCVQY